MIASPSPTGNIARTALLRGSNNTTDDAKTTERSEPSKDQDAWRGVSNRKLEDDLVTQKSIINQSGDIVRGLKTG